MKRSKITIYVPNDPKWVNSTIDMLTLLFGGATTFEANGTWLYGEKLVNDKVNICFSFCSESDLEIYLDQIKEYCIRMKKDMNQVSVAIEIDNVFYLI